ncbi:MAG: peptidoglycan-binding domain-containing protein [Alphaproteobacteria bacterium]
MLRRALTAAGVAVAAAFAVVAGPTVAQAQLCESNQSQLTQAIGDSQSALDRVSGSLDQFGRALISPRTGPVDATNIVAARANLDAFINALTGFSTQVDQVGQSCGPQFAADAQRLSQLVDRFEAERARADQLLADHATLSESGEPPLSQAQMESVQRALADRGHYQGGVDGRFGPGTRTAIAAFQQAGGMAPTGYLTPEQLTTLTQPGGVAQGTPAAPTPTPTPTPPPSGLPPAPQVGSAQPQGPASVEAQQICNQNIAEVNNAVQRTGEFRDQVNTRITDYRRAIRGPRVPPIDGEAGARIVADIQSYLSALQAFHDQAQAVVGQCGATFDDGFATLSGQLDSLATLRGRADQLNADYAALIESGEPAMSEETMRRVQTGLKNGGHYNSVIDAVFGPGTRAAVRAYQASIGAQQTGFLNATQIAALEQAAVQPTPPAPTPPTPTPPTPNVPTPPTPNIPGPEVATPQPPPPPPGTGVQDGGDRPRIADVRRLLSEDLAGRQPPLPVSGVRPGDGRYGDLWWRARDDLARGQQQQTVDQRLTLFGAAYLDRGAESLSMVDAHLVVGDAFARLGLFGDAAFHLQRAWDIWSGLDRDEPEERAILLERLAAARLAQATVNGTVGDATFDDLLGMLTEARAAAGSGDDGNQRLRQDIADRLADLYAAANREPEDAGVAATIRARYAG